MEDIDEAEDVETLSLLDYSINTTTAESEREKDYSTSINISNEEHYFEFCSEEWSTTTTVNAPENIIFCGKVIPFQESISENVPYSQIIKEKRQNTLGVFQLKSRRKDSADTKKEMAELKKFSVHKISVLASPGKFRWYLLFGIIRSPTKMALRDMKNRQSKRIPPSPLFRLEGGEMKEVKYRRGHECKNRGQQLWRLLKALSSGGHRHATTVVKAA